MGWHSHQIFPLLIFTDLDGTLLDEKTYSYKPAVPALEAIQKRNIPLILCSSKTRAEIEKIRTQLQNTHPFISENGGAVFIPQGYFSFPFPFTRKKEGHEILELGTPYPKLRKTLQHMKSLYPHKIIGFGDLSPEEIASLSGLSLERAKLSQKREYDEPFLLEDLSLLERIKKTASRAHLHITRGGRFFHLLGQNDKGNAVNRLKALYQKETSVSSIALGDSWNDLPMFQNVDIPVLVQKSDGTYETGLSFSSLRLAPGKGPEGWNRWVLDFLSHLEED
ncbi:HAD-IIB family hydrolase [bacterium]|nr:HAD-IIB family hydrolase [bacterium]